MSSGKRYYLAGPMSGRPQFNFPLFYEVSAVLRARGFDIISPAELDDAEDKGAALLSADGNPDTQRTKTNKTWADYLARDVKLIGDERLGVHAIIFLPEWETSRGACLEAFVGLLSKTPFDFYTYEHGDVVPIHRDVVIDYIMEHVRGK